MTDPVARIHRLATAIGTGPHAFGLSLVDHVRGVLEVIGDRDALAILSDKSRPSSSLPACRPLAPSRAVRSPRKAQGSTPLLDKIGVGYEPTIEEDQ